MKGNAFNGIYNNDIWHANEIGQKIYHGNQEDIDAECECGSFAVVE